MTDPDVIFDNEGTIVVIHAMTDAALEWVTDNVSTDGYQPMWPDSVIAEWRYAEDILFGMARAGLSIKESGA